MRNDNETPDVDALKNQFTPLVENGLFKSRTVLITGEINDRQARSVSERLLAMAGESDDPITLIVSSPGGHVESGDMIHDMIKYIKPRIRVLGTGWVASAGALIYVSAEREDRYCLPNTRFLLHEPRGGIGGSATEIDIQAREVLKMRERLNQIFAEATGQPLEKIVKDTNRDHWMNAKEAKAYGVVGKIIRSSSEMV
ncbi:MAG: ATP-dependent Clp protease proteolytic subunit [Parvibaculum sp.]|uniref:ATP-dependent Clp protease proteolytic subunit n=1 Tax=Parvibaculum sp. TaxID=2024848 RepID=UPI002726E31C|nr:ATP-dependent Clp protease proteolytic subunit [Parvibaculum sp.]MDO8837444.1 ATP-dependent Clp protease proteolytic subunit [Parvibaculum sp.]